MGRGNDTVEEEQIRRLRIKEYVSKLSLSLNFPEVFDIVHRLLPDRAGTNSLNSLLLKSMNLLQSEFRDQMQE